MAQRTDPYSQFNFLIEIDGVVKGGFSECSGLTLEADVKEILEGGFNFGIVRRSVRGRARRSEARSGDQASRIDTLPLVAAWRPPHCIT